MAGNDDRGMNGPIGDGQRSTGMNGSSSNGASSSSERKGTSRRGFASMDPNRQKEIASKGGRAAQAKGTAHEWSADEAREAGRKGGEPVSRDRAHMAAIGREGGGAGSANRRAQQQGGQGNERGSSGNGGNGNNNRFQ